MGLKAPTMKSGRTKLSESRSPERWRMYFLPSPFVDRLGIRPPQGVLNHAKQFAQYLETALADLSPADEDDRVWLTARVSGPHSLLANRASTGIRCTSPSKNPLLDSPVAGWWV